MTVMNTIAAKQLNDFKKEVDALIETGLKKDEAIFNVLREYIKQCKNIMFEGDGYSDDWAKEAKKRGLNNLKTTPEALKQEMDKNSWICMKRWEYLTTEKLKPETKSN